MNGEWLGDGDKDEQMNNISDKIIATIKTQGFSFTSIKNSLFVREFLLFSSSTILYQGSRFLTALGAAKILGPGVYGLWNMLNLILIYGSFAHLGVINAMNRDVPLFKGKRDFQRVEEIRWASLGFMFVSTIVAGAGIAVSALFVENSVLRSSLQVMVLLFLCTQMYSYLQVYLKSDKRFYQMSYQQCVFAAFLPVVTIPLVIVYKLPGFILGQTIAILAVSFLIIVKFIHFNLRPKLDIQESIRLIKVGFPIMAVGLLYSLLTTADRWVIASFLGVEQLGYYSLAIMVMGFLSLVPMVIAQQIYPRMAETYGRTSSYTDLKKWIIRQIVMALGVTAPLLVGVYFIFPLIVERFLPAYMPGITAMKIILIGLPFLSLTGGFGNFLNTVDKQVHYMAVQGFAVLINLGLNISFVKMGLGINGVAMGTALTYVIYSITLTLVAIRLLVIPQRSCSSRTASRATR